MCRRPLMWLPTRGCKHAICWDIVGEWCGWATSDRLDAGPQWWLCGNWAACELWCIVWWRFWWIEWNWGWCDRGWIWWCLLGLTCWFGDCKQKNYLWAKQLNETKLSCETRLLNGFIFLSSNLSLYYKFRDTLPCKCSGIMEEGHLTSMIERSPCAAPIPEQLSAPFNACKIRSIFRVQTSCLEYHR